MRQRKAQAENLDLEPLFHNDNLLLLRTSGHCYTCEVQQHRTCKTSGSSDKLLLCCAALLG